MEVSSSHTGKTLLICNILKIKLNNCYHGNIFALHFSSFTLVKNHYITYNCKTISHNYLFQNWCACQGSYTENLLSKVTLNFHFYKTYSDLSLQKYLFLHFNFKFIPQHVISSILVHISMIVNNETLFKVTLTSQFHKSYSHLNLLDCVFTLYIKLYITISFFKLNTHATGW